MKENSAGKWKDGRRSKEARSYRFLRGLVKLNLKRNNPIPPAVQEALEEEYGYEVPVPKGFGRNVQPKSPPGGPRQRPKRELTRRKRRPTSGSTSEEEEEPTAKAAAAAEEAAAPGAEPTALLPEVAAAAKSAGRVISVALATQEAALRRVRAGKAAPESALASNYRLRNAAIAQEIAEAQGTAGAAVEAAIRAQVLARDSLAKACSSCDERHRAQYPWVLERAARIASQGKGTKGATPIAPAAVTTASKALAVNPKPAAKKLPPVPKTASGKPAAKVKLQPKLKLQPKEQPEEKPFEEVAKSSKGPPVLLKPKQKPPGAPQPKWSGVRFPTEQESTDSETYTSGSEIFVAPRIARQTYSLPRANGRISCHTSATAADP